MQKFFILIWKCFCGVYIKKLIINFMFYKQDNIFAWTNFHASYARYVMHDNINVYMHLCITLRSFLMTIIGTPAAGISRLVDIAGDRMTG